MNRQLLFLLVGLAIFLGGCTLAPKYTQPKAPIPAEWPQGAAYKGALAAQETGKVMMPKWREFFTDARMQKLIETALNNNRDLRLAALNVERARALYGIQRAELFPVVNAVGAGSKLALSTAFNALSCFLWSMRLALVVNSACPQIFR